MDGREPHRAAPPFQDARRALWKGGYTAAGLFQKGAKNMQKTMESYPMELDRFAALYAADAPADKVQALINALERGKIAASAHAADDDGGTCNFDAPALHFREYGITRQQAESAIAAAGLRCFDWKPSRFSRAVLLVITGFQAGQANRHTNMAEAFFHSLRADGIPADMYYQMD